jgi:hypothetical protein
MARPGNQIAGREHVDATPILIGMRPYLVSDPGRAGHDRPAPAFRGWVY